GKERAPPHDRAIHAEDLRRPKPIHHRPSSTDPLVQFRSPVCNRPALGRPVSATPPRRGTSDARLTATACAAHDSRARPERNTTRPTATDRRDRPASGSERWPPYNVSHRSSGGSSSSWGSWADRKSTRLNSSHVKISYAVF